MSSYAHTAFLVSTCNSPKWLAFRLDRFRLLLSVVRGSLGGDHKHVQMIAERVGERINQAHRVFSALIVAFDTLKTVYGKAEDEERLRHL